MKFIDIIWIGIGGFLGTVSRYSVSLLFANSYSPDSFPWATFLVNILGSLLLGFIAGASSESNFIKPELRLMLTVGFCGAFTTFSTFMLDNFHLAKENQILIMLSYTIISLLLGFLALYLGYISGKYLISN